MTKPPDDELSQWRWQADRRWTAAKEMLELPSAPEELVAQTLHEAVERYLKWFLIQRGWQLQKTHDLADLIESAGAHDARLNLFVEVCARINGYFLEERYPHVDMKIPDREKLRTDFEKAKQLIKLLTAGA